VDRKVVLTLYYRNGKKGYLTVLYSLSKAMFKIAKDSGCRGVQMESWDKLLLCQHARVQGDAAKADELEALVVELTREFGLEG